MRPARSAAFVLAAILLVSGLATLPKEVAAQSQSLTVTTGPFFRAPDDPSVCPALKARPDGTVTQVRKVQVGASPGGVGTLTTITFRFELVADPGTSAHPGLGRALRWDAAKSSASGWSVREDNTATAPGGARTLTFTGGSLGTTPPGQEFTIAFVMPTNAVGDAPDPSKADSYPIQVVGSSASGATDTTATTPSFCIQADTTPPRLTQAITRDTTADGRLDQIELKFSEPIDPATLRKDEFAVHNPAEQAAYSQFAPFPPDGANPTRAFLNLATGLAFDTGVKPDVVYPASLDRPDRPSTRSLADLAGNMLGEVKKGDIQVIDGAKPVLVSGFGPKGAQSVLLTFSEAVEGTGPNKEVVAADLEYSNYNSGTGNDCVKDPLGTQLSKVEHPAPTPERVKITFTVVLCSDDVDHVTEGFAIRPLDAQPNQCPANEPSESVITCDRRIKDLAGLTALPYDTPPAVRNTSPRVIPQGGAEVSVGSFQLALRFNGPVSGAADEQPIPIAALDVVSADGTGEGPGGIIALGHRPGSSQAILTLDKPVRPTDVDDTPAKIRIRCNAIKGTQLPAFVPCYDPDGDGEADVPMTDQTPPSILYAYTYDGNRDGYLDGYKLIFSEPVDDSSFCAGSAAGAIAPRTCSHTCASTPDCNNVLQIAGVPGPYRWDTDLKPNDDEGIIRFNQIDTLPSFALPEIITLGDGLFTDLARPYVSGTQFPYVASNKMKRICVTNQGSDGCPNTVTELDGAPPVIWSARTLDTVPLGGTEGNGRLDGYILNMSEPVDDLSFKRQEWRVDGRDVTAYRTTPEFAVTDLLAKTNDDLIVILFSEGATPDTDARPELTYAPTLGGLKDLRGNPMREITAIDVNEIDDAPPTIVAIETPHALQADPNDPNSTVATDDPDAPSVVTVHFSEPVDDGQRGALVRRDFVYSNVNQAGASGMDDRSLSVQHTPGATSATIKLNAPLTASDVERDCIGANLNSIHETAATVVRKKTVGTTCRPLYFGPDTKAPGKPDSFAVTSALTTANSVTLTWTAPGNDGNTHGPVSGYLVKVGRDTLDPARFNSADLVNQEVLATTAAADMASEPHAVIAGNLLFQFEPDVGALAGPGQMQTLIISGLDPETEYHFMVRAYDSAEPPLFGEPSDGVAATTGADASPPTPAPVISSTTHRANTATLLNNAVFSWTASRDPESRVQYYWAFNQDPGHKVTKQDTLAAGLSVTRNGVAKGTWTFHVAAFSAGGSSATAHYTIVVGESTVDPLDIRLANDLLHRNLVATREGGVNIINWTLPPESELPPGATLQAIRIFRLQDDQKVQVAELPGNYAKLRTGTFTDNSTEANERSAYRVDMVFADGQVERPDRLTGFTRVVEVEAGGSAMFWWLLAAGVAVCGIGLAIFLVMRRRRGEEEGSETPAGIDPDTGLPTHDVRCPSCQTAFQAVGNLPLQIGCPKCGVTGLLQ